MKVYYAKVKAPIPYYWEKDFTIKASYIGLAAKRAAEEYRKEIRMRNSGHKRYTEIQISIKQIVG